MIEVTVDTIRPDDSVRAPGAVGPSSIAIGEGLADNGDRVTFAGDYRAMVNLYIAVKAGEGPVVQVEPYQIIKRESATGGPA